MTERLHWNNAKLYHLRNQGLIWKNYVTPSRALLLQMQTWHCWCLPTTIKMITISLIYCNLHFDLQPAYFTEKGAISPVSRDKTIMMFNPSGAEARIFWENGVNTMAADALVTQEARASAAMVLILQKSISSIKKFSVTYAISELRNNRKIQIHFFTSSQSNSVHQALIECWVGPHTTKTRSVLIRPALVVWQNI